MHRLIHHKTPRINAVMHTQPASDPGITVPAAATTVVGQGNELLPKGPLGVGKPSPVRETQVELLPWPDVQSSSSPRPSDGRLDEVDVTAVAVVGLPVVTGSSDPSLTKSAQVMRVVLAR